VNNATHSTLLPSETITREKLKEEEEKMLTSIFGIGNMRKLSFLVFIICILISVVVTHFWVPTNKKKIYNNNNNNNKKRI
jgi:hypothetical protein